MVENAKRLDRKCKYFNLAQRNRIRTVRILHFFFPFQLWSHLQCLFSCAYCHVFVAFAVALKIVWGQQMSKWTRLLLFFNNFALSTNILNITVAGCATWAAGFDNTIRKWNCNTFRNLDQKDTIFKVLFKFYTFFKDNIVLHLINLFKSILINWIPLKKKSLCFLVYFEPIMI